MLLQYTLWQCTSSVNNVIMCDLRRSILLYYARSRVRDRGQPTQNTNLIWRNEYRDLCQFMNWWNPRRTRPKQFIRTIWDTTNLRFPHGTDQNNWSVSSGYCHDLTIPRRKRQKQFVELRNNLNSHRKEQRLTREGRPFNYHFFRIDNVWERFKELI
jgi:hypothetical protein